MLSNRISVKVWGNYACFTRPEFKAERYSYDVVTPSNARNILQAIYWKPNFNYQISHVDVLHPLKFINIKRNEVNSRQSERAAKSWQEHKVYQTDDDRAQRNSRILVNPAYIIHAHIKRRDNQNPIDEFAQFQERVTKGKCYTQPFFGIREYAAFFEKPSGDEKPINLSKDLGLMLFDLAYHPTKDGPISYIDSSGETPQLIHAKVQPIFFDAKLERGTLHVDKDLYRRKP
jgi:CRISPR-associated protein Cas5d